VLGSGLFLPRLFKLLRDNRKKERFSSRLQCSGLLFAKQPVFLDLY
jgi:hypothetical protein